MIWQSPFSSGHESVSPPAEDAPRVLIVGDRGGSCIGGALERGARNLLLSIELRESREAMQGSALRRRLKWHLMQRTPSRLREFSRQVVRDCRAKGPDVLLTTGLAPIDAAALREIGAMGVRRVNYLTDDPWNPAHRAKWFFAALPEYDYIFSPRRANIEDLRRASGAEVAFLPFGYDPQLFRPVEATPDGSDILFAGGADAERAPLIGALWKAGLKIALYGSYWERFAETKTITRGQLPAERLSEAIASSKVGLCLVRRANRDGHSMRTFELPAVGICMLAEDTQEHRAIFGPDGQAAVYFCGLADLVEKAKGLVANPCERRRLAGAAHGLIREGRHTYGDRIASMLRTTGVPVEAR